MIDEYAPLSCQTSSTQFMPCIHLITSRLSLTAPRLIIALWVITAWQERRSLTDSWSAKTDINWHAWHGYVQRRRATGSIEISYSRSSCRFDDRCAAPLFSPILHRNKHLEPKLLLALLSGLHIKPRVVKKCISSHIAPRTIASLPYSRLVWL
jgi:hypothetical protein